MKDYAASHYTTLAWFDRAWLRLALAYHEWDAQNEARLIERVQDEYHRGIATFSELMIYKKNLLIIRERIREIRQRLGISK